MRVLVRFLCLSATLTLIACSDDSGDLVTSPDDCGDGVINPGEECDDNNRIGGDGCSATCVSETGGGEICDDTVDDDGDGLTDCADPDCSRSSDCNEDDCGNGLDDDGDGETDEADEASWTAMDIPQTNETTTAGTVVLGIQPRLHPGAQGATHFAIAAHPSQSNLVFVGGDRQDEGTEDVNGNGTLDAG